MEQRWWEYATWAARHSSPAVMKFLQWASTRRDMFPAAFCDRFESFHEHAPVHSWCDTKDALELALGKNWESIIELERTPIGSGCIAQVYRGKLRSTGQEVAVKVIHPHIKRLVEMDLDLMRAGVWLVERLPKLRLLSGRESVDEFALLMRRQLNLRDEAENLVQFSDHFRDRRGIRFPKPIMKYTSESVLVESFENGIHFSQLATQLNDKDRRAVARVVLDSYLRMVFLDNFAHGDMHPGNLLFDIHAHQHRTRRDGKHATAPGAADTGVVAIDAGIVTKLEPEDLRNFVELFHAVATGNGYKAGELIVTRSKRGDLGPDAPAEQKCTDIVSFCKGMEKIVSEALSWKLRLEKVHVGALLREVMELCCNHEVKLEGKYASIVISIAVLEGVGRKLDPDLDVLGVALPIIAQSLVRNVWK
jgi:aarF domain-containing kinase